MSEAALADSMGGRVLVAEDNPMNQRVVGAFLKSLGVDYVIAENGQEAINQLCSSEFALVLMDIQMPVLDGLSAIREIRAGKTPDKDIPIVVVTANAMAGDRDTYMGAGADEYLPKPITLNAMRSMLERFAILPGDDQKAAAL
jgi:CheY-like chemotaxis protein